MKTLHIARVGTFATRVIYFWE